MKEFTVNDFTLYYADSDDGGGTSIGLDFKHILDEHYPGHKFDRCLEWCSGPGFIGFDLLLNNYCKELTLVDKHQPAIDSAMHSLSLNKIDLRVNAYCVDQIAKLPAYEQFDLIVANPPHFSFPVCHQENIFKNDPRIYLDHDWKIHKEFFQHIHKYLTPNGIILLQESTWGCNYDTFNSFLDTLKVSNYYIGIQQIINYPIFYLELKHK